MNTIQLIKGIKKCEQLCRDLLLFKLAFVLLHGILRKLNIIIDLLASMFGQKADYLIEL